MAASIWIGSKLPTAQNLSTGGNVVIGFVGTGSFGAGNEAQTDFRRRTPGVGSKLFIRVVTNDRASSSIVTRVNHANGSQTMTLTGTGDFQDTSHTDTIAAGDTLNAALTIGAGGTAFFHTTVSMRFTPTTTTETVTAFVASASDTVTLNGVTRYYCLTGTLRGDQTSNQTESLVQQKMRVAGTFRNMCVNIQTNAKGGTSNVRLRVNGANGALVVPIATGVTGMVEDTSHSDTVAAGDLVNFSIDYFADGNNFKVNICAVEFVTTTNYWVVTYGDSTPAFLTVALNTTLYLGFGVCQAQSATEADLANPMPACTISNLSAQVLTNGVSATSSLTVRKAAADTAVTFNIGSTSTGWFEDATHSVVFSDGDKLAFKLVTGNAGTSIVINNVSVLAKNPVFTISPAGSVTPAGSLAKSDGKAAAGSVTPAGTLIRSCGKGLSGSSTPTGTLTKSVAHALAGTLAPAGALLKSIAQDLAGTVVPAGSLARAIGKTAAGSLAPVGTVAKSCASQLAGTLTASGSLAKSLSTTLAGTLTPAGALATLRALVRTFSGAITPAGDLVRSIAITRSGSITPAGSIVKTIATFWSGLLNLVGTFFTPAASATAITVTGREVSTIAVTGVERAVLRVSGCDQARIKVTGSID